MVYPQSYQSSSPSIGLMLACVFITIKDTNIHTVMYDEHAVCEELHTVIARLQKQYSAALIIIS